MRSFAFCRCSRWLDMRITSFPLWPPTTGANYTLHACSCRSFFAAANSRTVDSSPKRFPSTLYHQYSILLFDYLWVRVAFCVALRARVVAKTPNTGQNRIVRVRASVAKHKRAHSHTINYKQHFKTIRTQYDFFQSATGPHTRSQLRPIYCVQ